MIDADELEECFFEYLENNIPELFEPKNWFKKYRFKSRRLRDM